MRDGGCVEDVGFDLLFLPIGALGPRPCMDVLEAAQKLA